MSGSHDGSTKIGKTCHGLIDKENQYTSDNEWVKSRDEMLSSADRAVQVKRFVYRRLTLLQGLILSFLSLLQHTIREFG